MPWCGHCDRFFSDYEFGPEGYCEGCSSWLEEKGLLEEKQVYCRNRGCYQLVKKDEKLCSNCKNDKDAVRLTSCDTCYLNNRYGYILTKCRYHSKYCRSCSNKVSEYDYYCSEHINSCLTCEKRIATNQLYCEVHQREQEPLKRLVKQRTSLSNPQEVIRFNTWWNNNLATVINGDYSYTLWVLVYEPAIRNRSESLQKFEVSQGYDKSSLTSAKNKANSVKSELNGENPILAIHPSANSYASFGSLVASPYVKTIEVSCEYEDKITMVPFPNRTASSYVPVNIKEKVPNKNPENYLKPLDVVWVKKIFMGVEFYHVGVYLGNGEVCHFSSERKSRETNRTIITDWETFVESCVNGEVFAYHAVIPFKHYELIVKQIDWARTNDYDKGQYCLPNNNCEHHANSFVFGINYSRQVKEQDPLFWPRRCGACNSCRHETKNNGKGLSVNLTDEIKETNGELGKLAGYLYDKVKDQYEAKTMVPPKDCQIM